MSLAATLAQYLQQNQVNYQLHPHPQTQSAIQTAIAAHVPLAQLAKAVLLESPQPSYLLAVLPALARVHIELLEDLMETPFHLVPERRLQSYFHDCLPGAIPALGAAYTIQLIYDDTLLQQPTIYIEAGDHESLVCISNDQFQQLMKGQMHEHICQQSSSLVMISRKFV
ncbi:aminoacyl-tRNA deacylase [Zooshikella sp. RANM57]|uniref:aminoacyl-tRNA deacylase n=1 Tax=Zooshikella sp. RANM57 TaxID=3425863 RepID=UPI003D6FBA1B